jgi:uronate dehydrogenase
MPRTRATYPIGRPDSNTNRTARSRNSSEYFLGAAIGGACPGGVATSILPSPPLVVRNNYLIWDDRPQVKRARPTRHVLVTGAAGLIGGILCRALSDDYAVHGLDLSRGEQVEWKRDLRHLRRVERAFEGMTAVVDLAAEARMSASWTAVHENNLRATLNTFEAARRRGVQRVVFASSHHVVGMYERDEPYASVVAGSYDGLDPETFPRLRADVPIRPDGPYAVGKAFGEAVGRYYAEAHGISVICVRIGSVKRDDRPTKTREFATLLTHRDLADLVRSCLGAPSSVRFEILYGVSANTWRLWDIEHARRTIGYAPRDDAEAFR